MNTTFIISDAGQSLHFTLNTIRHLKRQYEANDLHESYENFEDFVRFSFKNQDEVDDFDIVFGDGFSESHNPTSRKPSLVDIYLHHLYLTR